jgi:hypothetical protein
MNLHRRKALLGATALVGAAALQACASSTVNGVTTITINTALVLTYVSGAAAIASALLGFPGVTTAIGAAAMPIITAAIADLNKAVPAINAQANGSVSFSFTTTSLPAFVTAIISDVATLQTNLQTALGAIGNTTIAGQIAPYLAGFTTIASAITGLFAIPGTAGAIQPSSMSVSDALALVHMTVPAK